MVYNNNTPGNLSWIFKENRPWLAKGVSFDMSNFWSLKCPFSHVCWRCRSISYRNVAAKLSWNDIFGIAFVFARGAWLIEKVYASTCSLVSLCKVMSSLEL